MHDQMAADPLPKTILLAHDNADDVALFRKALAKAPLSCQLRVVSTSLEVVDYLEGKAPYTDRTTFPVPSVLVLDMAMPQGAAVNLLRWLRASPIFRGLPVVALTDSDEHERCAMDLGATDFYVKSAIVADIVQLLQNINNSWLSPRPS